ncbi:GntR family transcriptional regulator [Pseudorhodoplanes sp.]|uniref:GntR family transcriptional regulator n=1 Tax=Pseudorhodoplanes sp. TaxID=1934341 RepID=UPI003D133B97
MSERHKVKIAKRQTVSGVTTERLRELILSGRLGAGEPLRQDELSAFLSVSRTPLREAIITLEAEGFVVNHPHRGAVVYKPTVDELLEIYEIRILLEARAAHEAAERVTPEVLRAVEGIVEEMNNAVSASKLIELNESFRHTFYSASGKRMLVEMIRNLTLRAEPYLRLLVGGPRRPFTKLEMAPLLDAIRAGDGKRAATITRKHLKKTVSGLLPILKG